jgi:hypothetical protein
MTTIVTIIPRIPVGPRISSRSFPREIQRTAAARSALSPSWVGGRHAAQYSNRRDGSARQPEPSAVVPDKLDCFNIGCIESRCSRDPECCNSPVVLRHLSVAVV